MELGGGEGSLEDGIGREGESKTPTFSEKQRCEGRGAGRKSLFLSLSMPPTPKHTGARQLW